jgi:HSP20 family protein
MANIVRRDPFRFMREWMGLDPFRDLAPAGTEKAMFDFVPDFEVKETKDGFVFKGDLPGVEEKDLDVQLTGNMLTIRGNKEEEKKDEGDKYYTYERSYGSFARSFALPEGVDAQRVHADLHDGVLTIAVPKTSEVKATKVKVKRGEKH